MLTVKNLARKRPPHLPYSKIHEAVSGKNFPVSLVFCGSVLSRRLNTFYRRKHSPANVLSFPLTKKSGEIFIDLEEVGRETKRLHVSRRYRTAHLFIHGLLHLKGLPHGSTMEHKEEIFLRRFGLSRTKRRISKKS